MTRRYGFSPTGLLFGPSLTCFCTFHWVLFFAMLLSKPWLKLKPIFRLILILPWAIPSFISIQVWHAMFNEQFWSSESATSNGRLKPYSVAQQPYLGFRGGSAHQRVVGCALHDAYCFRWSKLHPRRDSRSCIR